jgi:hypothetical protein
MSDEGFHGGDLFTISADGHDVQNRTQGRKSSVSSLFWQTPDRILFTEYVGGGSAISELTLSNNSVRTIWKGAEGLYAFGNFRGLCPLGKRPCGGRRSGAAMKRRPKFGPDRSVNGDN